MYHSAAPSSFGQKCSEAVKQVLQSTCAATSNDASVGDTDLLNGLFAVVEAFRKDLYGQQETFDKETVATTVNNFSRAFDDAADGEEAKPQPQRVSIDLNVVPSQAANGLLAVPSAVAAVADAGKAEAADSKTDGARADVTAWSEAVAKWEKNGWSVEGLQGEQENSLKIGHAGDGNPGLIIIGLNAGHYSLQAQYGNDADFAKALKWDNGGRRFGGTWWEYLPDQYFNIQEGELYKTLVHDSQLQKLLIERIEYLQRVISTHHRTATWKDAIGKQEQWNTFIWYWKCLACESKSDEEGMVFFDIVPSDDAPNVVEFRMGNRKRNANLLKSTLERIGRQDATGNIQADCSFVVDRASFDASEIASKARQLMQKISG